MSISYDLFDLVLRQHGQSLTDQRKRIFTLLHSKDRFTMNDIISAAPEINRATIYRIIATFESIGVVNRLHFGFKHSFELSDTFRPHHHHMHCTRCNRIYPIINIPQLETAINDLATQNQFVISSHVLEIIGICRYCHVKNSDH